jgi:protoporphyrinogen oxidase
MTDRGQRWAVVGGGLLGLTLAYRLAEAGERVTVLEAAPELGGLASVWQLGDVTWDRHYHVIMLSDTSLRRLLADLGLESELRFDVTRTGFFTGKGFYRMATAIDYLKFPALSLFDKVRLAATLSYISRIKDGRALEKVPLADWLTRISGRRVFEQIWRPLLAAKMGDNYKIASASFIWSYVARIYAARKGGMKREMYGYVPGGYARILSRFAERLSARGVGIELASPVQAIERDSDGRFRVTTAKGAAQYDRVIVTAAGPHVARMGKDLAEDERKRLNGIVYQGIICASALIDRPLAGYYLTYITDGTIPFTAIVEMSALVDKSEFGGRSLVYLPRYVTADDPYWQRDDAAIEEAFLAGLKKIYPDLTAASVKAFRVSRVRQVYAISTLNYSDHLPPMITSAPGLYVVNSAHIVNGTLAVNESVALAERALPDILAAARALPVPAPTREHAA